MFAFEPTPREVKALMPQRLDGEQFGSDTVPTLSEVKTIIVDVCQEVAAEVGVSIPNEEREGGVNPHELAKYAVKLGSVAEIERTFWPEQHDDSDESTYSRYYQRYRDILESLKAALTKGGKSYRAGTIRLRSAINP